MATFPDKNARKKCWTARDIYWQCLDRLPSAVRDANDEHKHCKSLRADFEQFCSAQWVFHFDRKRKYNQFKDDVAKHKIDPFKTQDTPQ